MIKIKINEKKRNKKGNKKQKNKETKIQRFHPRSTEKKIGSHTQHKHTHTSSEYKHNKNTIELLSRESQRECANQREIQKSKELPHK